MKKALPITASRRFAWLSVSVLVFCCAGNLGSETMKMITYYPAPYGSYKKFMTTGTTLLATKTASAKVGVGTKDPRTKLDVDGIVRLRASDTSMSCPGKSGALRYSNDHMQYCDQQGVWQDLAPKVDIDAKIQNYLEQNYSGPTVKIVEASGTTCPDNKGTIVDYYWDGDTVPAMWAPVRPSFSAVADKSCTHVTCCGWSSCVWCGSWPTGCGSYRFEGSYDQCTPIYKTFSTAATYSKVRCAVTK